MSEAPKTIFIDIDGTIFKHAGNSSVVSSYTPELLPGVKEKFVEWDKRGYTIIITTGRRKNLLPITHRQLTDAGLFFDELIMGLPRGKRVVINDVKPGREPESAATGINVERDHGLENIDVRRS